MVAPNGRVHGIRPADAQDKGYKACFVALYPGGKFAGPEVHDTDGRRHYYFIHDPQRPGVFTDSAGYKEYTKDWKTRPKVKKHDNARSVAGDVYAWCRQQHNHAVDPGQRAALLPDSSPALDKIIQWPLAATHATASIQTAPASSRSIVSNSRTRAAAARATPGPSSSRIISSNRRTRAAINAASTSPAPDPAPAPAPAPAPCRTPAAAAPNNAKPRSAKGLPNDFIGRWKDGPPEPLPMSEAAQLAADVLAVTGRHVLEAVKVPPPPRLFVAFSDGQIFVDGYIVYKEMKKDRSLKLQSFRTLREAAGWITGGVGICATSDGQIFNTPEEAETFVHSLYYRMKIFSSVPEALVWQADVLGKTLGLD
ncbi:hypothetical protein C8R46DRAFT_1212936 [Mycena filopes]|nr:hypothetical protein C8R46DRAFT_1212936 [Mycena filopes]